MATKQTAKTQDELVKELFNKVQEKKRAVEKAERPIWETNGSFGYTAHALNDRVDIKTVTDTRKISEMLAFLIGREKDLVEANETLGLKTEFKWLNYTRSEWEKDFKTRVNQILLQTKKKELAELESRLNALISPELKAQMELAAIQEALGD